MVTIEEIKEFTNKLRRLDLDNETVQQSLDAAIVYLDRAVYEAAQQGAQADTLPRCEISSECYFGQDGCCLRGGECR